VVVGYYGPFPGRHIKLLRNHAFSVASFDTWCFSKITTFSENSQCLPTFFAELLWWIGWCEVVPCSDRATAYIIGASTIQAPAGDRWEKQKPSWRRKWPYWCTTAAARLAVPMPGCTTTAASLHPNGDICGAFLPS
jgi:hypothetical protein